MHKKYTHTMQYKKSTQSIPGRNWSLLKWLLNLLPTWRTSETCLEKYKYTGMDLKQNYKLDPPGMEDMLIAVWATAACPEYIETGIPKLDESPDMPANTNTLTGRLESWNSMELDKWVTFKIIGWHPSGIFVITDY